MASVSARGKSPGRAEVTLSRVAATWWPLAASWGLMGAEQPAIGAVIARLAEPKLQLAAYGGVVFPLALVIEAPVIMLLAASTELSRDPASHRSLRRFTHQLGAGLTLLHILIAFTPLYDALAGGVLGVPDDVRETARVGLMIMTPWTWAIAWRRFNQGVLIRFGRSGKVGLGTATRLATSAVVLGAGLVHGGVPGIVVGSAALSIGVMAEGVYAAIAARAVVRGPLAQAELSPPLSGRAFVAFYLPLALTPLITLVIQPVGAGAISRMPEVVSSLAVWPVINSLAFLWQSVGLAFNEVVVALLGEPGARAQLRRFTTLLVVATTVTFGLLALTPLADLWMEHVAGLSPELAGLASAALWLALPIPGCRALQSWFQGKLVVARKTGAVTEAVVVFFVVCAGVLGLGVAQQWRGIEVVLIGFSLARIAQTVWLAVRARGH